jgi:hypothetical protein
MSNKKGQAAMEFLMTYGWAILVVLIALGALFYLGVFNPKTTNTGSVAAPFSYIDHKIVAGGTGTMNIGANSVSVTPTPSFGGYSGYCTVAAWTPVGSFNGNGKNTIALTCPGTAAKGDKYTGSFDVTYTLTGGISHTTTVTYSGTVE